MLGINKITVSDQFDDRGNAAYVVEVDYYFETSKNRFGSPGLDLSKKTNLYSLFQDRSGKSIVRQDLMFPTFLDGSLNPTVKRIDIGFRYPFSTTFNIKASEALNFSFELSLYRKSTQQQEAIIVELFSGGDLLIENNDNIPIEDQRTVFYDDIFNFDLFKVGSTNNNSTVSELLISYGKDKSIKGMFLFDKQRFLIDNSDFGKLLNNDRMPRPIRNEIMRNSLINNLKITRRKLSYLRDFQNRPYPSYDNQVPKNIAIGSSDGRTLTATKGILEEITDLDLSDIDYESIIAFNDIDLEDVGKHQYSLEMRIQDGILNWLIDTVDRLINIQDILKSNEVGISLTRTIRSSMRKVVRIIFALNGNINITQKDLSSYLTNMTKHNGSSLILQSYITNLVNKVSNLIGKAGVISQANSSYSKVYSKNNSELFFLDLSRRFGTVVDFESARNPTYDYLGFTQNADIGATRIPKEDMQSRADREFRKLIKEQPQDGFANLSAAIHADVFNFPPTDNDSLANAYFNFEPNYYAFMSPVRIGQTNLNASNTFNFDAMTREHFKKKYDDLLTPQLSISYYFQNKGLSVGQDFFSEDPPLQDAKKGQTYLPANAIFSDSDKVNTRAPLVQDYQAGVAVPPESNASITFANMFLRNEEGWNLSREDFSLTNKTNLISSIPVAFERGTRTTADISPQLKAIREMPNQIRAIFASNSDKCVNQWLSPSIEGDYIYSPNTYYTIKQNYMNLVKIEYLAGFAKDGSGLPDVKNPIFKKLTDLNGSGKIICRASIYNDERFRVGVGFDNISYTDEYFIIDLTE